MIVAASTSTNTPRRPGKCHHTFGDQRGGRCNFGGYRVDFGCHTSAWFYGYKKGLEERLWAERRCGELLQNTDKNKGILKRGTELPQSHGGTAGTLADMGLSKNS